MPQIVTKVLEVNIEEVLPNRFQPRIKFNEEEMGELTKSIKEYGVIQPIVVRKVFDKYEIIAGERRYKASVLAGKKTIPVVVVDLNDKESAEIALIENVQRKDLTPIEEAISYKRILDMGYTQETLATKLGKDQSTLANKLRLLNLSDDVQNALLDGQISERHARTLLKLTDEEKQKEMLKRIIDERLTVRQTEEEVKKMGDEAMNSEIIFNPTNDIKEEVVETVQPVQSKPNSYVPNIGIWEEEKASVPIETPTTEVVTDTSDIINTWEKPQIKEVSNPGFMNINKIENEAADIYVEKPLADTSTLLKEEEKIEPLPVKEEDENEIVPGKFFTLFANEEDESDDNNEPKELEKPIGFDMYNQEEITPVETKEEEPIEMPSNDGKDFMDFFNQKPIAEVSEPTIENEIKLDTTPKATIEPDFVIPLPVEPTNTFETKEIVPEIPAVDYAIPEQEEIATPIVPTTSIKKAIDIVRNCADELEALGYHLDLEEFDYENMYQVIFKIEK